MPDDLAIQTRNLGRRFGARWVVQDLNLEIPKGAVFGFLGLNGAGKSTTIRMLMGLLRRSIGTARVLGLDPEREGIQIKRRVGYVADSPLFYDWMRVDQMCDFVANYRRENWSDARAADLLRRFRVPKDARLKDLSKGQRAKTSLVLALAFNPDLLLLDEPTSGLDPVARREFIEGVLAEYQDADHTILISSHLVNELSGLVDRIGILHEGKLVLHQSADDFMASIRRVRLAFDGLAPKTIQCPGMLRYQSNGREALLTISPFSAISNEHIQLLAPTAFEIEAISLDDAFVDYIAGLERNANE